MKFDFSTPLVFLSLTVLTACGWPQLSDRTFDTSVSKPAFEAGTGPHIAIDEAHQNFHTAGGRYKPFADVLISDGYQVSKNKKAFEGDALSEIDILVVANALPKSNVRKWINPIQLAFTNEEVDHLKKWVEEGGSLLLIADHMPFPAGADNLALAFGFSFQNGFSFDTTAESQTAVFKKSDGSLSLPDSLKDDFPDSVASFMGQAFECPEAAHSVLNLNEDYLVLLPDTAWAFRPGTPTIPGARLSQGAIMEYGNGKVAVFGEAAIFSAQVAGRTRVKAGMNSAKGSENMEFLRSLMRWLGE